MDYDDFSQGTAYARTVLSTFSIFTDLSTRQGDSETLLGMNDISFVLKSVARNESSSVGLASSRIPGIGN